MWRESPPAGQPEPARAGTAQLRAGWRRTAGASPSRAGPTPRRAPAQLHLVTPPARGSASTALANCLATSTGLDCHGIATSAAGESHGSSPASPVDSRQASRNGGGCAEARDEPLGPLLGLTLSLRLKPRGSCLPSFHLFTPRRRGTLLETHRATSRRTRTAEAHDRGERETASPSVRYYSHIRLTPMSRRYDGREEKGYALGLSLALRSHTC